MSIKQIFTKLYRLMTGGEQYDEIRLKIGQIQLDLKREMWKDYCPQQSYFDNIGFQVFSQWNEDGIIQFLINNVPISSKTFIEFGVENYTESNTRFLLINDNWKGFIMDGSKKNIQYVINDQIYWKHNINVKDVFITKDNINELIKSSGFDSDVGILSIDIDGNDYWIWSEINTINPSIVICEYNGLFGNSDAIIVPYKCDFYRTEAHYSNLYYGASLQALIKLATKKGYSLVCVNSVGNNAFFVRNDLLINGISSIPPTELYKEIQYRESRDKSGNLTYLSRKDGVKLIKNMVVIDLSDGIEKKISDCKFYDDLFK